MYFQSFFFPEFLSTLAAPGETGTLHKRLAKIQDTNTKLMFRAKTGTLSEPENVASLAGYSRMKNGQWIAFAFIVNMPKNKHPVSLDDMRNAIDSNIQKISKSGQ